MASPLASAPGELLQAAADGDLALFKRIARQLDGGEGRLRELAEGIRHRGARALHVAARHGRLPVCAYLVEELQVDVNAVDDSGETPLAYAVHGASVDAVSYLLDHGASPDKPDNTRCTPLHLAAEKGDCEIVKALLSKGANVDPFFNRGTPLHVAVSCKHDGIVEILLDHHADCNKAAHTFYTPLIVALNVASLECVKLLVKAGADVNAGGTVTPLIFTVSDGLTDFFECLLEAGADPNVQDDSGHLPIEIAAYNNNRKGVEILLPLTSPAPYMRDWSVDGIFRYVKSLPRMEDNLLYKMKPADLKLEGGKAYKREDYFTAMKLYSVAVNLDPDDATLYSNRSLCWLKMGDGDQAFMDAQFCRIIRPDWPKACYLQGAAQMLREDYEKACDSFLDGLKLDPGNVEIENALRDAVESLKESYAEQKGH